MPGGSISLASPAYHAASECHVDDDDTKTRRAEDSAAGAVKAAAMTRSRGGN